MSYEAGKPITGFTLTLDATAKTPGGSEAVENILRAAMVAVQKEVDKAGDRYFAGLVEMGIGRAPRTELRPPWPVHGEVSLRTDA